MQHRELKMAGMGFVALVLVGFFLVGSNKETPEEKAAGVMFQSNMKLRSYSQMQCQKAIKDVLGKSVYAPTESKSLGMEAMALKWVGGPKSKYKLIECAYTGGQGIQSLVIDGETLIPKPEAAPAQDAEKAAPPEQAPESEAATTSTEAEPQPEQTQE